MGRCGEEIEAERGVGANRRENARLTESAENIRYIPQEKERTTRYKRYHARKMFDGDRIPPSVIIHFLDRNEKPESTLLHFYTFTLSSGGVETIDT
jgi:hypothetical protein